MQIQYQKSSSINNQREIDLEVDPGIIGGIVYKLIWRYVYFFLEEKDRQRGLEKEIIEVEDFHRAVGFDKEESGDLIII